MAINLACSVPGDECTEPGGQIVKGMCLRHYHRARRAIRSPKAPRPPKVTECSVGDEECSPPGGRIVKGMCLRHYGAWHRRIQPPCRIEGCEQPIHGQVERLCVMHLRYKRLYGNPHGRPEPRSAPAKPPCPVPDCDRLAEIAGMCARHYRRDRKWGSPTAGGPLLGKTFQFLSEAVASATDECILWPFGLSAKGYGVIRYQGKGWPAHRLALTLAKGEPEDPGLLACHVPGICHTRHCINPRHIYWGDEIDNMADKVIDGTDNRGVRSWKAKLWDEAIHQIRHVDPRPDNEVALDYGVTKSCIQSVRDYRTWKHLP